MPGGIFDSLVPTRTDTDSVAATAGATRRLGRFRSRTLTSPLALALEPRFMFDAAGVATGGDAAVEAAAQEAADQQTDNPQPENQTDPLADALSVTAPPADRKEVVFVDPNIQDVDALLAGVHPAAQVVVLDPTGDGLSQIADYMADQADIDAVHILSHGQQGGVHLGGMTLDLAAVEARGADLAAIGDAMTADGDVLLYGCDVADGVSGQALVEALAQATGADVAASSDDTGHADVGGDWDLEVTSGTIEAGVAVNADTRAAFQGQLQVFRVTTDLDNILDDGFMSLREAILQANATVGEDTITFANGSGEAFENGGLIRLTLGEIEITDAVVIDGDLNGDGIADIVISADALGNDILQADDATTAFNESVLTDVATTLADDPARLNDDNSRIFNVTSDSAATTLIGLALTGGRTTADGDHGGAVLSAADLTVIGSVISGNSVAGTDAGGGGLYVPTAALTVTDSTVSGNWATGRGGGVGTETGDITVSGSLIDSNVVVGSDARGGGVGGRDGTLTITNSTVSANRAEGIAEPLIRNQIDAQGGGVFNANGDIVITDSQVTDNSATVSGQTATPNVNVEGGGVRNSGGATTVVRSVVSGNVAQAVSNGITGNMDVEGGGLRSVGDVTIIDSTVSNNLVLASGNTIDASLDAEGGGIRNSGGDIAIINATLASNAVVARSNTVTGTTEVEGGAARAFNATVSLVNATVTGNYSSGVGGGIAVMYGSGVTEGAVSLANSLVTGNGAGTAGNDIYLVAGATQTVGAPSIVGTTLLDGSGVGTPLGGTVAEVAQSLFAETTSFVDLNGDGIQDADEPLLGTDIEGGVLADNGGATLTVALAANALNPALDAGDDTAALGITLDEEALGVDLNGDGRTDATLDTIDDFAFDQRGDPFDRAVDQTNADNGGTIDLGAVETQSDLALVVDTLEDVDNGDYSEGDLSLREALELVGPGGTITFDDTVFTVDDDDTNNATIVLDDALGELVIAQGVTINGDIDGDGIADVTIDGNEATRVFSVDAFVTGVTLDGLVIQNGYARSGGGLYVGYEAEVAIANTTFTGNEAPSNGGGIYSYYGNLTVTDSSFIGNRASSGGGIYNYQGALTVVNATISGNTADFGGGIHNNYGTARLVNTTVSGNTAYYDGGGIENFYGTVTLWNTTVSGNSADGYGGGIDNWGGSLTLNNSIIAGNSADDGSDVYNYGPGTVSSNGYNIFGSAVVGYTVSGLVLDGVTNSLEDVFAQVGANPYTGVTAGVLADNGGLTQTIALKFKGIAVDAGDNLSLPNESVLGVDVNGDGNVDDPISVDQLGFDRIQGGTVNLGAVEADLVIVVDTTDDNDDGDYSDGNLSLREALSLVAPGGRIVFDDSVFDVDAANTTTIDLALGQLLVNKSVSIAGDINGDGIADVTVDASGNSRVFLIDDGDDGSQSTVAIDGLVITGGNVGFGEGGGGGIENFEDLTLTNSSVSGNFSAVSGGGISNGAIGTLMLANSAVSGNAAIVAGGGIDGSGTITLINSTVSDNTALVIAGGGISHQDGTMTLINSTVSGNTAVISGGGIIHQRGTMTLINSTVSGNSATRFGGGIDNVSGTLTLNNSIIAGNNAGTDSDISVGGTVVSNGYNIFGYGTTITGFGDTILADTSAATLQTVFAETTLIDPDDDPTSGDEFIAGLLADNGGLTQTIALNPDGVAVDNGDNDSLPTEAELGVDVDGDGTVEDTPISVDQLGGERVSFGTVDRGAVEVQATVVVVDTTDDGIDFDYSEGNLSLREALALVAEGGTIVFDETVFDVDDDDTNNMEIDLGDTLGELVIAKNVTILGDIDRDGIADVTIDGNDVTRVFRVLDGVTGVALDGLVIKKGFASYGTAVDGGGGLRVEAGAHVSITNTTFTGNFATRDGGAIFVAPTASLTLTRSTVSDNGSGDDDNAGFGGGISSLGDLTVVNSTISDNTATYSGAGIFHQDGTMTLTNVTLSGNSAGGSGGGVWNGGDAEATLNNVTVSGNSSGSSGGGINNSATLTINNSIVAGNNASLNPEISGSAYSNGHNIFGYGTDDTRFPDDTILAANDADTLLTVFARTTTIIDPNSGEEFVAGLLADNGGPTQTIALNPLSAIAVDTGDDASLPNESDLQVDVNRDGIVDDPITVDQRGVAREFGDAVDIGAYEVHTTLVVDTVVDEDDGDHSEGDLSLREALKLIAPGGTILFDETEFIDSTDGIIFLNSAFRGGLGDLVIAKGVTIAGDIDGDGIADVTIDGSDATGVFSVLEGVTGVTLDGLVVQNGEAAGIGGGLYVGYRAGVTVTNTTFTGNRASGGGGIYNSGTLTLVNSTISGNTAASFGGGLSNDGIAVVTNTTISGNTAGRGGGGIDSVDGVLTLTNVTVTGNSAADGGGIYNAGGTLAINNSIVAGNNASLNPEIRGGANSNGANIFGYGTDDARFPDDIILAANDADTLLTIFAETTVIDPDGVTDSGDEFVAGLLADNGGSTLTVALNPTGIAIDAGDDDSLPTEDDLGVDLDGDGIINDVDPIPVDQIGSDRIQGLAVNIGAVETPTAVIVVDTVEDEDDGDYSEGDLSLREALTLVAEGGTILFDETEFTVNTDGTIFLNSIANLGLGRLIIEKGVTIDGDIDGDGIADVTIDGRRATGVFSVLEGVTGVTLDGLVIQNGSAEKGAGLYVGSDAEVTVTNTTFTGNGARAGGGIHNIGTLTVVNATVSGNVAAIGGGIYNVGTLTVVNATVSGNSALVGGGIATGATAVVTNTTISGNSAVDGGGGMFVGDGAGVTVTNSVFTDNTAIEWGGGIYSRGALAVTNTTISDNYAGVRGGGIHNYGTGGLTVTNSTISDNEAGYRGGGIANFLGTMYLANVTLSGNYANDAGGAIYHAFDATTRLYNTTLSGNAAGYQGGAIFITGGGIFAVNNSIVAGNAAANNSPDIAGEIQTSNGANIFGSDVEGDTGNDVELGLGAAVDLTLTNVFADTGDVTVGGLTFEAGLLDDNRGPTQTIALNRTGIAVDEGNEDNLPTEEFLGVDVDGDGFTEDEPISVDQRGFARVLLGAVDIGAIEVRPTVAADDAVTTDEDTALDGNVLADNGDGVDTSIEGDDLLVVTAVNGDTDAVGTQVTLASGALLTVNAGGSFTYDPNGQFEGLSDGESATDSFTYTIEDDDGGSDTATVVVTINGVDDVTDGGTDGTDPDAGDVPPVILSEAAGDAAPGTPTAVDTVPAGDPVTTLDNTGGAADPNTDVTPDTGLSGDLPGPAAGDLGSLVLFGVPITDVAAGLPPGAELSGFESASDLLASLNPAAGPNAGLPGVVDLELHGFPLEDLALFLVGDFELSTVESRNDVLSLVAASTDGATVAERLALLEMLERLGLFADRSISLAELQGQIDLFGLSLGEMAAALDGVDLDAIDSLADLQAALGDPPAVQPPTEAGVTVPWTGAPAFTDQLAGAFTAFDRDAAALGAALAQIGGAEDRLAA